MLPWHTKSIFIIHFHLIYMLLYAITVYIPNIFGTLNSVHLCGISADLHKSTQLEHKKSQFSSIPTAGIPLPVQYRPAVCGNVDMGIPPGADDLWPDSGGVSIYTQMTALEKRSDVHDRQRRRNRLDALFTACLIAQAIFLEDRVNNHQLRNLCLYRAKLEGTLIGTAAQNNI